MIPTYCEICKRVNGEHDPSCPHSVKRQPWYKEGRRPQRIEECSECGRRFRDKRTDEEALIQAIFGRKMCPECKQREDFFTCTACNEPVEKREATYYENLPYHSKCLPGA